jgi:hypothetical protein
MPPEKSLEQFKAEHPGNPTRAIWKYNEQQSQRRSERRRMKLTKKQDAFGEMTIQTTPRECGVCGETCLVTIGYKPKAKLPEGIKVEDTILKSWETWIGLDCGDYAKFHRQVAHIADAMRGRSGATEMMRHDYLG